MMKLANDFLPTLIVVAVIVMLAVVIIYNSNRNQREIIETVRHSHEARVEAKVQATLEAIRQNMKDDEAWLKAVKSLESNSTK